MTIPEQSLQDREAFLDAAHGLVLEFRGLPAGSVLRCLARAYREGRLAAGWSPGSGDDVLGAAVIAARARLEARRAPDLVRRPLRPAWSGTAVSA